MPLTGTTVTLLRDAGGTQNSSGAFVQGQVWPTEQLSITLSGRVDHWRNYNGRNLETNVPAGTADRGQPDASRSRRHGVQPARGGALSREQQGVGLGQPRVGLPGPDAQRALPPVPRRRHPDAGQRRPWPRAPGRRRAGAQHRAGRELHASHDLVRQPDEEPGVQRHHRHQHPAAAEPGPDAHLGPADGRRVSVRPVLARVGRLSVQPGEGRRSSRRIRRWSASTCRRCRRTAAR